MLHSTSSVIFKNCSNGEIRWVADSRWITREYQGHRRSCNARQARGCLVRVHVLWSINCGSVGQIESPSMFCNDFPWRGPETGQKQRLTRFAAEMA